MSDNFREQAVELLRLALSASKNEDKAFYMSLAVARYEMALAAEDAARLKKSD
jgi:hypothetical protein